MQTNFISQGQNIDVDKKISELIKILQQTYKSTTTRQIKEAEEKLKLFDDIIINNLDKIFDLLSSETIDIQNKKSLAIRLKYIYISFAKTKDLNIANFMGMLAGLVKNLIGRENSQNSQNLDISIIEQICEAIRIMINHKILLDKGEELINLSKIILKEINSDKKNNDLKKIYTCFSVLCLIILSPNTNKNNINLIVNQDLIKSTQKFLLYRIDKNLTIKLLDLLTLSMKKLLYHGEQNLILDSIKKKDDKDGKDGRDDNLLVTIFRVLMNNLSNDKCVISFINEYTSEDKSHIDKISKENLIKSKIFLALNYIIDFQDISDEEGNIIKDVNFKNEIMKYLTIIFNSIDYLIKNEKNNFENNYKIGNYEIILYQALSFFYKALSYEPFKKDFSSEAKDFVFFKIFPLFTLNLGDSELFLESPEEYYNQVIDTMTNFNFKKVKTICGKILILICDNYPEQSFIILDTTYEILNFFMEAYNDKNLYKYTLINNGIGEFYYDHFENEAIINVSLLFLSILAKITVRNIELKNGLHKFLLINQMRLENVISDKIQFSLSLFYGLFLDFLFDVNNKEDKEFIKKAINFLLSIILYSNKKKEKNGLSNQAYHSLELILGNEKLCEIANELIKLVFDQILQGIPSSEMIIFFDMINLFTSKIQVIKDNIIILTNAILNKIANDYNLIKNGKDDDGIYSTLIHKELAIVGNIISLEEIILIILNFCKKENKSNVVLQILNSSYQIIYEYYISYHILDSSSFKIINYLLLFNGQRNMNNIKLVNNILIESLTKIENNFYGQENIIFVLLLIICWLYNNGANNNMINNNELIGENDLINIIINIITIILNKLYILIENDKENNNKDNNLLKIFYISVIYTSFIFYSKYTFSLIYDKNFFTGLLKLTNDIIINNSFFYSLKLSRLIIFGLSKILYENEFLKLIIVNFKDAFIVNYNLLSRHFKEETKETISKEDDEDENENNDKNGDYLTEKIQDIINNDLILDKYDYDEFIIFQELYKKLIGIQETQIIIGDIVKNMDEKTKKDFEGILSVKKVYINNNKDKNVGKYMHRIVYHLKKDH